LFLLFQVVIKLNFHIFQPFSFWFWHFPFVQNYTDLLYEKFLWTHICFFNCFSFNFLFKRSRTVSHQYFWYPAEHKFVGWNILEFLSSQIEKQYIYPAMIVFIADTVISAPFSTIFVTFSSLSSSDIFFLQIRPQIARFLVSISRDIRPLLYNEMSFLLLSEDFWYEI